MTPFEKQMKQEFLTYKSGQASYDLQAYKNKAMHEPLVYKKRSNTHFN